MLFFRICGQRTLFYPGQSMPEFHGIIHGTVFAVDLGIHLFNRVIGYKNTSMYRGSCYALATLYQKGRVPKKPNCCQINPDDLTGNLYQFNILFMSLASFHPSIRLPSRPESLHHFIAHYIHTRNPSCHPIPVPTTHTFPNNPFFIGARKPDCRRRPLNHTYS